MNESAESIAQLPWYAIRVKSNCERVVSMGLRARGYEDFLPVYRTRRTWSDRQKDIDRPLFPGYVFCRLDLGKRQPVIATPGVVSIIGIGLTPVAVSEAEMDAVQKVVRAGLAANPWPFLQVGDRVLIERGPLAGIEGRLVEVKRSIRVVLSIELLQRSIAAEVDKSWVRPIKTAIQRTS
jgi:transcription antitermination factor NusG